MSVGRSIDEGALTEVLTSLRDEGLPTLENGSLRGTRWRSRCYAGLGLMLVGPGYVPTRITATQRSMDAHWEGVEEYIGTSRPSPSRRTLTLFSELLLLPPATSA